MILDRIVLYCSAITYWLKPDEICSLEGNGSYTNVRLSSGEILKISRNLKNVLAQIPQTCNQFVRVQKSWVVNANHIRCLYSSHNSILYLKMLDGTELPLSSKTNAALRLLALYGGGILTSRYNSKSKIERQMD